ncbi:alpha/beta hydrolase [Nonomuraea sp. NEAU-A123]|uniref:alpha/beta hydrolase n=1 Tax=Nonomuraea sp. NEAU-A123 TaxID=2839649 RepID=UPI001BE4A02B|nr:alpha/beta hydrolase [Nonomuraea sp. NEAU-A123]MBT2233033.1 alpha/beta hydrolase family protein [Nonomuraea sp. NEAU-A123]
MLRMLTLAGSLAFGAVLALPSQHSGRLVKVYGDLATADRVAIVVPGADTTVATFEASTKRPGGAARALLAEATKVGHGERLAVVAWLGYDAPPTWSLGAITDSAAVEGAKALRRTVTELHARTSAPIALLCHSYGSVVCAKARPDLPVADMALFGSPGIDAPSDRTPSDRTLPNPIPSDPTPSNPTLLDRTLLDRRPSDPTPSAATPAATRVWAGVGGSDWIRFVPKVKLGPLGFGADALSPGYGARVFEVGPGGHSDYFAPGTPSLRNLTLIALGRPGDVVAAAPA